MPRFIVFDVETPNRRSVRFKNDVIMRTAAAAQKRFAFCVRQEKHCLAVFMRNRRFPAGASKDEVKEWYDTLDLNK